jgi:formate dehydrogenase gamma subunit
MAKRRSAVRLKDRRTAKRDRAAKRAKKARKKVITTDMVIVTSKFNRALHWYTFIMFFLTLLTGVFIMYRVHVMPEELHGVRGMLDVHIYLGLLFMLGIVLMILKFLPRMFYKKEDAEWFKVMGGYFRKWAPVPPAYRFNAGQKLWTQLFILLALVSFGSGMVMWLMQGPMQEKISPDLHRTSLSLHAFAYAFMVLMVLIHFYFTTAATPGAFGAMWGGIVTRSWAMKHHPLWLERLDRGVVGVSDERMRRRREKTMKRKKKRIAASMKSEDEETPEPKKKKKYSFKKDQTPEPVEEEINDVDVEIEDESDE